MEPKVNRESKDTMFSLVFSKEKYQRDLVHVLCGGDLDDQEILSVTLGNVLLREQYNDLGLLVGDTMILLVEAQSTEPTNIAVRMLSYYASTLNDYIAEKYGTTAVYGTKHIILPCVKLFCIYTGSKDVQSSYHLSGHFKWSCGEPSCDLVVDIIDEDSALASGVAWEYIRFCDIERSAHMEFGDSSAYAQEVIRRCKSEGIFTDIIATEEAKVMKYLDYSAKQKMLQEAWGDEREEEGMAKGMAKGRAKGKVEERERLVLKLMRELGWSREEAEEFVIAGSDEIVSSEGDSTPGGTKTGLNRMRLD